MKQVLFIQGAGEGAYDADKLLADSLQKELGTGYEVRCPEMPDEDNAPYDPWKKRIEKEIEAMQEPVILVGHSMGASYIAKYLTEIKLKKTVAGIFLLATPFWGGEGWLYEGYEEIELPEDTAKKFPQTPTFLYQTIDDEIVPFDHLALYAKLLPQASVRELPKGGHQFNNDLTIIATDIKGL
jgi:uncharacterized protein